MAIRWLQPGVVPVQRMQHSFNLGVRTVHSSLLLLTLSLLCLSVCAPAYTLSVLCLSVCLCSCSQSVCLCSCSHSVCLSVLCSQSVCTVSNIPTIGPLMSDQEGQVTGIARHSELEAVGKSLCRPWRKQVTKILPVCGTGPASLLRMVNILGSLDFFVPVPVTKDTGPGLSVSFKFHQCNSLYLPS